MSSFGHKAYRLARPLLFVLPAEPAHRFSLAVLPLAAPLFRLICGAPVADPVEHLGLRFSNRVGLAAGLDKDGAHIDDLSALGFGFVEVGTVTPLPQPGNAQPRLFRLPEHEAIINRMGFNNLGLSNFLGNVRRRSSQTVLGLNIGKNASTAIETAIDDYLVGLDGVYPHADYVTINISSPNTENLRSLQEADQLGAMLNALNARRAELAVEHDRRVPVLVKIAPDLDDAQIEAIADAVVASEIDGVIATNTTIDRSAISATALASEAGGLSGLPVAARSDAVVRSLRAALPSKIPIIGVGGIDSRERALAKFEAGADLIQLYSGLIYQGPALVRECALAARDYFGASAAPNEATRR